MGHGHNLGNASILQDFSVRNTICKDSFLEKNGMNCSEGIRKEGRLHLHRGSRRVLELC